MVDCTQLVPGLEAAAEHHAVVDCTQLVPGLEAAAEHHGVVDSIPRLLLAWRRLVNSMLWLSVP